VPRASDAVCASVNATVSFPVAAFVMATVKVLTVAPVTADKIDATNVMPVMSMEKSISVAGRSSPATSVTLSVPGTWVNEAMLNSPRDSA
jgi:hypothetical protein